MADSNAEPGPVLGVDPGDARVGLAISDPARTVAVPMETIPARGSLEAIGTIVAERGITLVVVGHPVQMSGGAGERARVSEGLAERLRQRLGVGVELQDERLSSAEAERALRDAGTGARKLRSDLDASAAAVILQAWLDAHRD